MKPLTIEQLKALPVGEWVWVATVDGKYGAYGRVCQKFDDDNFRIETIESYLVDPYETYGTKWLAYKNKEQAEAKGEIVELPCKIGDPIWVVYRDFDHGFNEYKIYESICTGFAFENGTKIRIVTAFCCYDFDRVGNYTDKSEAERRLAELKGERKYD